VQFRGHTGPFLDPAQGAASLNILKVARFELHIALKRSIEQALTSRQRVTTEVNYPTVEKRSVVAIDVVPLEESEATARCLLVMFRTVRIADESPPRKSKRSPKAGSDLENRNRELESELSAAREFLQATVEEKEGMLEELKSANEELQSANEELQSTNEELETSREELQSTNEELTTVNDELESRMSELGQTNDDLHNVLSGVDNAVVIVGMDLRIRRYTSAAEKLFKLVPADIGREIGFIDRFLGGALEPRVSSVIQSLSTLDEDVLAANQRWYTLKIAPYKTLDHSIRGALVTLVDIDVRKRAAEMTHDVAAYAARFLIAIGHPLLIIDRRMRVVWCNELFLDVFQIASDETIGNVLTTLGAQRFKELGVRVAESFGSSMMFRDVEIRVPLPDAGERVLRVGGSQIPASGDTALMLLSFEPITNQGAS